jgi:hypothetical protein
MHKNKVLLASPVAALVYLIVAINAWIRLFTTRAPGWSALFSLIWAQALIPGLLLTLMGMIFGFKAYTKNKRWLTLCSVILYLSSALLVSPLGLYLLPAIALGLLAFIQMGIQTQKAKNATEDMLP